MKCSVCSQESTIKQGNQMLCDMHYRFGQMRSNAKRHGKTIPSREQLSQMSGASLVCPDCNVQMNWRAKDGQNTVASLQHYRDGSMNIVCRSCNTRHAFMPEDSYREMPKDHKLCPACKSIKPLDQFTKDNYQAGQAKRKRKCRSCSDKLVNEWKEKNRDKYNQYQREYRAKRKAQGNPVSRGA
jgi:hypothetical protein